MDTIEGYKFGRPYTEKIPVEEADKFATIFGEGSPALTKLIKYCIINSIVTFASCKGHPKEKSILNRKFENGYITFRFDKYYANDDFAYFLASIPQTNKKIRASLDSNYVTDRTITFYVPARFEGESEKYFEFILNKLKEYKKKKEANIKIGYNPDIVKMVDYIFYSWNFKEELFDITQSKYEKLQRQGAYYKRVSVCKSNEQTGILHSKFGHYLLRNNKKNIDEFINSSSQGYKSL